MRSYFLPSLVFKKQWIWFENPHDILDVDMVTFFSYSDDDFKGFSKRRGHTSIIKLDRDLAEIWSGMRKKFIREQIRKGELKGIVVKRDKNFEEFEKMYKSFRSGKGLAEDEFSIFRDNGVLFSAYWNNTMLAGGIFIADGSHVRAWILASSRFTNKDDGSLRETVGQANRMIIWESIKWAHSQNIKIFDLGGLDIPKGDEKLPSLSQFKEAFGGERVPNFYYTKIYSKFLRLLSCIRNKIKK